MPFLTERTGLPKLVDPERPAATELIGRDPRNPFHIRAAMRIIMQHAEPRITHKTRAIINRIGISTDNIVISDVARRGEKLIGSHFLLEEGLRFSDNIIGVCDQCHSPIQYRPESSKTKLKLCVFCGADATLKEMAEKSSPKKQSKKPVTNKPTRISTKTGS